MCPGHPSPARDNTIGIGDLLYLSHSNTSGLMTHSVQGNVLHHNDSPNSIDHNTTLSGGANLDESDKVSMQDLGLFNIYM